MGMHLLEVWIQNIAWLKCLDEWVVAPKGRVVRCTCSTADHYFYGGHGIVSAQTPLGTGLAFATKYEDEVINEGESSHVTLCFMGDGALNQGCFYEAMNLAGVYENLPVIYVVENNRYSMGTAIERGTSMAHDLHLKADRFRD